MSDHVDQSPAPVWNRQSALQRLMNNEALLNRILKIFFEQAETHLTAIRDNIQQGRLEEARAAAHALKGSAGEVGADRMHQHLGQLENALVSKAAQQAADIYKVVVVDYQQVCQQAK
ncbi:Hpt domain-containing protein [Salinimonas chungwhensis]|uniref:Hpt domain-containing protein n=1 Tax=Salinimonas chungwhensis TaxID=265425 RepID=UPI000372766A|nr:Hpt domain-containing protein [Salinimonas chungwhensis]